MDFFIKRAGVSLFIAFSLITAGQIPIEAAGEVTRASFPFHITFPDVSPCTGEDVIIDIEGTARMQATEDGSGGLHGSFHLNATLTETLIASGESFEGMTMHHQEFNLDQGEGTFVVRGHITKPGFGNNISVRVLVHISPNGMVISTEPPEEDCH